MSGQQRLSDLMPRPLTTRSKPWLALATYGSIGVGFATLVTRTCLKHPLFPIIYPQSDATERAERAAGRCTRTTEGMQRLAGNMFASMGEMMSWTNVVNPDKKD